MAIKYGIFNNPPASKSNAKSTKHVRITNADTFTSENLIEEVVNNTTLTHADVAASLAALREAFIRHFQQGDNLQLDGLGVFTPRITGRVASDSLGRERGEGLQINGITFRPERSLLKRLTSAHFELEHTVHEVWPSDKTIEKKLTEFFATHNSISTQQCSLCLVVPRNRALKLLTKLAEEGALTPVGTSRSRSYVPAQGYFGH